VSGETAAAAERNLRTDLRTQLLSVRASTLALFADLDRATFCCQAHPDFSPAGWHLGHIGFTEGLWLLERLAGEAPVDRQFARIFAVDALPKAERCSLPPASEVHAYLAAVRARVLALLDRAAPDPEAERLWRFIVQHEAQHAETATWVIALQRPRAPALVPEREAPNAMVRVPTGTFQQGSEAPDALDNERPAHDRTLPGFWIDRFPVTQAEYARFMAEGGYRDERFWSPAGWQWRSAQAVEHPLWWSGADGRPVVGVSWYEADAYARWAGKRLPTESEWERAARLDPIGPQTRTGEQGMGVLALVGCVWEWTDTWFAPYAGFASFPYAGYSAAYFDGAHRVLKGCSRATRPVVRRASFRNWYTPDSRVPFAGLRCARD